MKKFLSLLLALLICLLPAVSAKADSSVCFVAVNDSLLPLSSRAISQGGQYYVPASVFAQLHVYSTYHSAINTTELTGSSKQLFFDHNTGETYDSAGSYYSTSAVMMGSVVYVPVDFVCRQFGLSWSYIAGSGYGDVCRLTDGSAYLTDDLFVRAARPLMESRYNEFMNSGISPGVNGDDVGEDGSVIFLSFQGIPGDTAFTALSTYGVKATFFLTADEILENPDAVRRIVGEGHNIGALCASDPGADYADFSEALWREAHMTSVLISAVQTEYENVCRAYADSAGLVYSDYSINGVRSGYGMTLAELNSILASGRAPIMHLRLACGVSTDSYLLGIINTLRSGSTVLAECETV